MAKTYKTEEDFRASLQQRLIKLSDEHGISDVQELMRKVAFDRFLCHLFLEKDSPWILKGGYALELQLGSSRTTKDIDLVLRERNFTKESLYDNIDEIKGILVGYIGKKVDDYFEFILTGAEKSLDNTPYGGKRFSIECRIAGRRFVSFHIDISVNDVSRQPICEEIEGKDWLGFAGIPPIPYRALAFEEIFAEKLHAYTLPRDKENTRVRDLLDMYLLIKSDRMKPTLLSGCVNRVFNRRDSHSIPAKLAEPPKSWPSKFQLLAEKCGVEDNINVVFQVIVEYLQNSKVFSEEVMTHNN